MIEFSGALCLIMVVLGALWLRTRSQLREARAAAAAGLEEAQREAADLREMLDAIPVPVWRRGPDLTLVDCNRAYADAFETTAELAVFERREPAIGAGPGSGATS